MAPGIPKIVLSGFDLGAAQAQQTPWSAAGNLANATLTAWLFWGLAPRGALVAWTALVWLGAVTGLRGWWRNRGRAMPGRVSRRPVVRSIPWAGFAGRATRCGGPTGRSTGSPAPTTGAAIGAPATIAC